MNKKLTLLSAAVATALAAPAFADINDIIISEYVEGSIGKYATNSAIEITNTGENDFTFNGDYALYYSYFKNKVVLPDGTTPVLNGVTVPANGSVVIINSDATDDLKNAISANNVTPVVAGSYGQVEHSGLNFNGGEAVWIAKGDDKDAIHDIIGKNSDNWGANVTYRRTNDALTPAAEFDSKAWVEHPVDTYDDLGKPTFEEPPISTLPCTDAAGTHAEKTIGEVQGEGFSSPLIEDGKYVSDDEYLVTGVVSGVTTSLMKGFYLYDSDGNEKTSDGVFVATKADIDSSMIGQKVCVKGVVEEKFGLTQLLPTDDKWEVLEESAGAPAAVEMTRIPSDGDNFRATLERHEGMLVSLVEDMDPSTPEVKEDMRVSRTFSWDYAGRKNNMVLAYKRPNMQPNQEHVAGSQESKDQAAQNRNYRLFVDSDKKAKYGGTIPYYPKFNSDPATNYIRINDSVTGLEGLITYSYGEFRLIPTNEVDDSNFKHNTNREASPILDDSTTADKFALRIATQNVLNFFNSPYGGAENTHGDNRGAENKVEFDNQKAKIVEAIYGLDADIIGLMEIENNGFGDFSAITELVNAVNEKYTDDRYSKRNTKDSTHNRYVFVGFDSDGNTVLDEFDSIGGDAITSGLLYRPNKVTLEYSKIIPMPSQQAPMITDENGAPIVKYDEVRENGKNYQRDTVAATFKVNNTGKKLTVSVNHLKSKGSTCWEDWQGWEDWNDFNPSKDKVKDEDFQGSCENFRVAAAVQLGEEMAKMGGDQVVMGDMNSYANEDPMLVLTGNPTGKTLKAARDTFIGYKPQFGENGAVITKTYGYLNAVGMKDAEKGKPSWSYSYNDEIGSLDHVLITPSLKAKLLDATDWHINAAESKVFDYKVDGEDTRDSDKKGEGTFYVDDAYRSSDHDSALIALSYGYGETDGDPVLLSSKSGMIDVAYNISTSEAKDGDIAEISFSPTPEGMENVGLPRKELTKDGEQTVMLGVSGVKPGLYTVTMQLKRPATTKSSSEETLVPGSTVTMNVEVAKRDTLEPKTTVEPYDGSGGSFGIFGLLSMLGLGFLRRSKK